MTTTSSVAGSTPAPKNLLARFIGVITSPKETFQAIVPTPKWFGILAVTTILIALFSALPTTTPAGQDAALEQQLEQRRAWGAPEPNEEQYAQMERMKWLTPVFTGVGILIVIPLVSLIVAGILFAVFNAGLGGEASYKQVLTIVAHAGAISTLGAAVQGTVNYFRGAVTGVMNLGALLPMLPEKSFVANLLGTIDIFMIWYVIVLAIGLGVLYKRRTQPIAITFFSIYAVIALVIAVFRSRG